MKVKNRRNYYRILQIQPDAPNEVIKASYRTLMKRLKCHPDLGGTHSLAALVNDAYRTLSHPRKRAEYDLLLLMKQSKASISLGSLKNRSKIVLERPIEKDPSTTQPHRERQLRCPLCHRLFCRGHHRTSPQKDRRRINRMDQKGLLCYVLGHSGRFSKGEILDLSPKGMRFISVKEIKPYTEVEIENKILFGTARITNCHELSRDERRLYVNGVKFMEVKFRRSCGTFLSVVA
ncbi:J domain-containing protein [Nitrospira defluvii]|nr:J domain-containing protein [Nitrospira defluvii]